LLPWSGFRPLAQQRASSFVPVFFFFFFFFLSSGVSFVKQPGNVLSFPSLLSWQVDGGTWLTLLAF
jgi:hypothetical protein